MRKSLGAALLCLAALPPAASAEHANIDLIVAGLSPQTGLGLEETSATADQEPPVGGVKPRPLAKFKAGQPLVLQFVLTNTYPHGVKKDVGVRYFVVREAKAGQKMVPQPEEGMVTQGQFRVNMKPGTRVGARVHFKLQTPGIYLLRVESINTQSDHEHMSAIDIQVN